MNGAVVISDERFLDAGEQDADGQYNYYYSGAKVVVEVGEIRFNVVFYDDDPSVAVFKSISKIGSTAVEIDPVESGFRSAVQLLVARYQISSVGVYEPKLGAFRTKDVTTLFDSTKSSE